MTGKITQILQSCNNWLALLLAAGAGDTRSYRPRLNKLLNFFCGEVCEGVSAAVFYCGFVIHSGGGDFIGEEAEAFAFTVNSYGRSPFIIISVPRDAFVPASALVQSPSAVP